MPSKTSSRPPKPFRDRAIEKTLVEAAEIGVAVLKKYHRKLASIEKKGEVDLVTRADREAEARVFDFLRKKHPTHQLIGEETSGKARPKPGEFAWILDPVDGTTNYAHGLDHYALSLAVTLDNQPLAGVVVQPAFDHWYRAILGRGAFRNRTRLRVSKNSKLSDCIVATGFPYDRRKRIPELMARLGQILLNCQAMRRYGVASLDLAFTAAGQFDAYYEGPLNAWDVAAGALLVTEAGGKLTDYEGKPFDLFNPWTLASNGLIHAPLVKILRDAVAGLPKD